MKKHIFLASALLLLVGVMPAAAQGNGHREGKLAPGKLVKAKSSSAVYYIDEDLTRYVFPNVRVFKSWYGDFKDVVEVDDDEISLYRLAGNVPYKAAKRLVKLTTDPKVYAVDDGGILRWVKSEKVARKLYGDNWNALVDDLSDAFFADYTVGADIEDEAQFNSKLDELITRITDTLRAKRLKLLERRNADDDEYENHGYGKNKVAVCHNFGDHGHTIYIAKPALNAHLSHGDVQGRCADDQDDGDDDNDDDTPADTTAPEVLTEIIDRITDTAATVYVVTDEETVAEVFYGTENPLDLETAASIEDVTLTISHNMEITGLTAATIYYVQVVVTDEAGNSTTRDVVRFTTDAEPDTTAPVLVSASIEDISDTTATVDVEADEDSTATVYYGTESPLDLETALSVEGAASATSHSVALTELDAETDYYVVIVLTDDADNETTVEEKTFTTEATPDTTAPVIGSEISLTVTDTSITVNLTTDEETTVIVYVSAVSPVDIENAASTESATLATAHAVELTELTPETEYYLLIVATDEAGNESSADDISVTTEATPEA